MLQRGVTDQAILAGIAGSDESFARLGLPSPGSSPTLPVFGLATAFDSTPSGDAKTTMAVVSFEGISDPGVKVTLGSQTVFTDASGRFTFHNVALDLGDNTLQAIATDAAGQTNSYTIMLTRQETIA